MADFPPVRIIFNFDDCVSNSKDYAVKVCITFSVVT